jgi:translation initiation factor 1
MVCSLSRRHPHPRYVVSVADECEPACNGTIIQDKDMGEVIQLQGDHRTKVMDFLTDKDKSKMGKYALQKDHIKIHGF